MKILITGVAGFIGYHLATRLLEEKHDIIGIDNMNDYYDLTLKTYRLDELNNFNHFIFKEIDLIDSTSLMQVFLEHKVDYVIHLAAQASARYSTVNPKAYADSNLVGFLNILEACRHYPVKHMIYASSSSVYGGNNTLPFSTNHSVDHPMSLYAATKKANELMAHSYSHLYNIPTTGLRFFTVYGPYGRPDMAYFSFTKHIFEGDEITVFNHGKMERDFTYIDDIVESIIRLIVKSPSGIQQWQSNRDGISSSFAPYKIYNIGNSNPVTLERFITILEENIGLKAKKVYVDMQQGDVLNTYADIDDLESTIGYRPTTSIEVGLGKFVTWYRSFYQL